jgi:gentisate 1,2-dioxygenase
MTMPDDLHAPSKDWTAHFGRARTLDELQTLIEPLNVVTGWGHREGVRSAEPSSPYRTYVWRYRECRAALDAASKLISAEEAGRRILNFRNPVPGNALGAARTLLHAYQLVLPGEKAPAHRHTAHALRVILDGRKMYSVVNGEKTLMETGDVVLTPGGCWHSHAHDGDETACWIDGLDVPLVNALQLATWEPYPDRYEPVRSVVEETPMRFSHASIQRALDRAPPDPDGYFGTRIRLEAPTMPTLGLSVQRLAAGQKTRAWRSNANTSFCVMAGSGRSVIAGETIEWRFGDIVIAPTWRWIEHHADEDAQLFSMSDEPLLRWAQYFKFEGA